MVISGEGADEIFGGYLYFHKAPNKEEFHRESCRKVYDFMNSPDRFFMVWVRGIALISKSSFSCLQIKELHLYDCLRANKATSAWGLEVRVPFLDKEFINVAMAIDPEWKMVEK